MCILCITDFTPDRTQSALSGEEKLNYYQSQLKGLAEDLGRTVNVHVAHHVEDIRNKVTEVLERIDGKTASSQPPSSTPFQSIIPPPPTDMFTGRGEYLQKMKDNFGLPKTSVEMRTQRKFVLYGTGGIGKTQLALKFLDENPEQYVLCFLF